MVLGDVPPAERCRCADAASAPSSGASAGKLRSWLSR